MDADTERAPGLPVRIADGHDNRPVNARCFSSGSHVARFVRLNIAGGDGFVAFGSETGHAFTDWHTPHNLYYVRRQTNLSLQDQDPVLQKVYRTCICAKATDDLFKLSLHAGNNNKSSPQASISLLY